MEHYAGIDVSLKESSVCVVDATGKVVREVKVTSEPEALVGYIEMLELPVTRIGLEAGAIAMVACALVNAGRDVVLLETRHVKAALSAMTVKTDRKDVLPARPAASRSGPLPSAGYKVDISRGERIGRVSSEWFSRPDDERFLSLGALHAGGRTLPMVAALSANHLAALLLPNGLRRLYIARDNDPAGRHAAEMLAENARTLPGSRRCRLYPRSATSTTICASWDDPLWQTGPGQDRAGGCRAVPDLAWVQPGGVIGGIGRQSPWSARLQPGEPRPRPSERAVGPEPGRAGNGCAGLFSAAETSSALHREAK